MADRRILNLIACFLKAGVMEGQLFRHSELGVPQGGPLSPLLANVYGRLFGRISTVPSMAS
jgi:RNA-directed DNA polymerase